MSPCTYFFEGIQIERFDSKFMVFPIFESIEYMRCFFIFYLFYMFYVAKYVFHG
jgi:hypothetical protein